MLGDDKWVVGTFVLKIGKDLECVILILVGDEPSVEHISLEQIDERGLTYLGDSGSQGTVAYKMIMKMSWNASGNLQAIGPWRKEKA